MQFITVYLLSVVLFTLLADLYLQKHRVCNLLSLLFDWNYLPKGQCDAPFIDAK